MKVTIDAPADLDPLEIAQAVVGPHILLKAEHKHSWETRPFVLWQSLQDMYELALKIYRARIARMHRAVEQALGIHDLEKAIKPLLTPAKLREIAQVIQDHHVAMLITFGMRGSVSEDEIRRLVAQGIVPAEAEDIIQDAYLFGELVASVRELEEKRDVKTMKYAEFKEAISRRPIALTDEQKRAIEWSKHSAAIHIRGLGNRWSDDFSRVAIEADANLRRKYQGVIRDAVAENIDRQQTVRKLASDLGHATEDWSRDFGRIAATEKQQAFAEGFVSGLQETEGPPQGIYVAKIPAADCCPDCARLYLTDGIGSRPRVFRLSELMRNVSNKGLKRTEWKPGIPPTHPWCQCTLIHLPNGWDFEQKPNAQVKVEKVKGREAWLHEDGKPWRPRLMPETLRRGDVFARDLLKSFMKYDEVPEKGVVVRIHDPELLREVDKVIAQTPKWLFDREIGVTLITWDHPRSQVPLEDHDLAYWTGNEIRISHHVTPDKIGKILRHELGHALNVYLVRKWGGEAKVREWHDKLYAIAQEEGFVSPYAGTLPIECAAEATRLYLYERKRLMLSYPKQFAELHRVYRDLGKAHANTDDAGISAVAKEPEWAQYASRRFEH